MKILVKKNPDAAAEAMREHVTRSMGNTLQRLKPYFKLRKASKTYVRSEKSQKKVPLDSFEIN
jgi:hypothetical protein